MWAGVCGKTGQRHLEPFVFFREGPMTLRVVWWLQLAEPRHRGATSCSDGGSKKLCLCDSNCNYRRAKKQGALRAAAMGGIKSYDPVFGSSIITGGAKRQGARRAAAMPGIKSYDSVIRTVISNRGKPRNKLRYKLQQWVELKAMTQ